MSSVITSANDVMPLKEDGSMYKYKCSHYTRLFYADTLEEIATDIKNISKNPPKGFNPQKLSDNNKYEIMSIYRYDINTLEPRNPYVATGEKPKPKYLAVVNGNNVYSNTIRGLVLAAEKECKKAITIHPMEYDLKTKLHTIECLKYDILINTDKSIKVGKFYNIKFTNGKIVPCYILGETSIKRCNKNHNQSFNGGGDVYIVESKSGVAIISKYIISEVQQTSEKKWME